MIVIPAIDLINGACVRLRQGDYSQVTSYQTTPLEIAKQYERAGFKQLHLVDLDGARAGKVINWEVVRQITGETGLTVDFGGGIKTKEDAERLFSLGVQQLNIGSLAFREPETFFSWIEAFGAERIILSADVRDGSVAVSGWTQTSGMTLEAAVTTYTARGVRWITCTDISRDGMMQGPAVDLYSTMTNKFPDVNWVASGGVSSIDDLIALQETGCKAAIAGKSLLDGKIDLNELAQHAFL
ncbi:MAG: 1-(5-phosphoribosyl)-5-[(5-phosphoribosylamino)methylideneamino]imidazole-4-carboxamide isomerase [Bacteroidota bacterium]